MRILILNEGSPMSLGSSYQRAFRALGHDCELVDPAAKLREYAGFRNPFLRRAFDRKIISKMNQWLAREVIQRTPDLLWVGKGDWALPPLWHRLRQELPNTVLFCYSPDDPLEGFSRGAWRPWIKESIPLFDVYATYKKSILSRLSHQGAPHTLHVPFAWDNLASVPATPYSPPCEKADVLFVGNEDADRKKFLTAIAEHPRMSDRRIAIFGKWRPSRSRRLNAAIRGHQVSLQTSCELAAAAGVTLNVLRRQNTGSHNMRTFEVPASGGLMLSQRASDQGTFFPEAEAAYYFDSIEEAVRIIDHALSDAEESSKVRKRALELAHSETYLKRAAQITGLASSLLDSWDGRRPKRIVAVATHPIQYQSPIFREVAKSERVNLEVIYGHDPRSSDHFDTEFGQPVVWDTDLRAGFNSHVLPTALKHSNTHSFLGTLCLSAYSWAAKRGADLVLIQGWYSAIYLIALAGARSASIPVAIRCEARLNGADGPIKRLAKKLIHGSIVRKCRYVLPIGLKNQDYYNWLGSPRTTSIAAPYCIDAERMRAVKPGTREQLRKDWGVDMSTTVFLFCGKLIEKKRPLDVIKALVLLGRRQHQPEVNACLVIMGSGNQEPLLREAASASSIPVVFTGFVNQQEMPDIYAACDCLVLPSTYTETWGVVVNEAMTVGCTAIVSDRVGCADDLVQDDTSGLVVPYGHPECIADAMEKIACDPDVATRLKTGATNRIQEYAQEITVQAIIRAATKDL